jgi:hypothetical protein
MVALSGVRATATCGVHGLEISLRRESEKPVGDRELLKIVTSDFLATGGSDFFKPVMPFRNQVRVDGPIVRDEIAQWLIRSGGTWRARDLLGPDNRRLVYSGPRPVECKGAQ